MTNVGEQVISGGTIHARDASLAPIVRSRATLLLLVLGPFLAAHPSTAHVNSAGGELRLKPDGPAVGTFQLRSASGADLRGTPGTATIQVHEAADEAGAGELAGSALGVNEARRVDPSAGRPLLGQAPAGSTCVTGSEPWCLPWDHCDPTPAGPLPPCSIAASVDAFEAINGWSIGFSHLDTNTGGLTLWNSTNSALTGQPVDPPDVLSDT